MPTSASSATPDIDDSDADKAEVGEEDATRLKLREIRHKAVDLLSRREHSRHELTAKLAAKFDKSDYGSDLIEQVLDQLVEKNYLSDERFASQFAAQQHARGYGEFGVYARLAKRGIDSSIAKQAIVALEADWFEHASETLTKRFAGSGYMQVNEFDEAGAAADEITPEQMLELRVLREKQREKQGRFLKSRGFAADQIIYALEAATKTEY